MTNPMKSCVANNKKGLKNVVKNKKDHSLQWRIQDFPEGGGVNSQRPIILQIFFAENCMKMKEFGTPGDMCPWHSALDPRILCQVTNYNPFNKIHISIH